MTRYSLLTIKLLDLHTPIAISSDTSIHQELHYRYRYTLSFRITCEADLACGESLAEGAGHGIHYCDTLKSCYSYSCFKEMTRWFRQLVKRLASEIISHISVERRASSFSEARSACGQDWHMHRMQTRSDSSPSVQTRIDNRSEPLTVSAVSQ